MNVKIKFVKHTLWHPVAHPINNHIGLLTCNLKLLWGIGCWRHSYMQLRAMQLWPHGPHMSPTHGTSMDIKNRHIHHNVTRVALLFTNDGLLPLYVFKIYHLGIYIEEFHRFWYGYVDGISFLFHLSFGSFIYIYIYIWCKNTHLVCFRNNSIGKWSVGQVEPRVKPCALCFTSTTVIRKLTYNPHDRCQSLSHLQMGNTRHASNESCVH
jgi:hypothetical protein